MGTLEHTYKPYTLWTAHWRHPCRQEMGDETQNMEHRTRTDNEWFTEVLTTSTLLCNSTGGILSKHWLCRMNNWFAEFSGLCNVAQFLCQTTSAAWPIPHSKGPWRGVWLSGVYSKFSVMSGVGLTMRVSGVGLSGVPSVGLAILSVGVGRHWFRFECQCRMENMG